MVDLMNPLPPRIPHPDMAVQSPCEGHVTRCVVLAFSFIGGLQFSVPWSAVGHRVFWGFCAVTGVDFHFLCGAGCLCMVHVEGSYVWCLSMDRVRGSPVYSGFPW